MVPEERLGPWFLAFNHYYWSQELTENVCLLDIDKNSVQKRGLHDTRGYLWLGVSLRNSIPQFVQ